MSMRPLRRGSIWIAAFAALGLVLLSYVLTSTSATDRNVRVILSKEGGGERAVLQNASLRPVVVTTCEVLSDDLTIGNESFVNDAVQRKSVDGEWRTVLKRDFCNGPMKLRLLWPRQKIYSARFYANVGFQFREGESFQQGNTLRFVLFPNSGPHGIKAAATELYSPEFTRIEGSEKDRLGQRGRAAPVLDPALERGAILGLCLWRKVTSAVVS